MPNVDVSATSTGETRKIFDRPEHDAEQDRLIGDFRGYVRNRISHAALVLEIGPSYMPVLPRAHGYTVEIVDHASGADLRAKYGAMGVDVSRVEEVDHVWTGGPISALTGEGRYRYVFASHVVEHMTNLASFLADGLKLLAPGGELILLVPDKRYCFDLLQPLTDSAKVLADHMAGRQRHSFEAFYREDFHVVAAHEDTDWQIAWWSRPLRDVKMKENASPKRLDEAQASARSKSYEDAHEYYFTPSSFAMIVNDLRYLGLLPGRIETLTRARGCEFLVSLARSDETIDRQTLMAERRRLGLQILRELREGADALPPPDPAGDGAASGMEAAAGQPQSADDLLVDLQARLAEADARLLRSEAAARAVADELRRLRTSVSWRVTTPLRAVRRVFR